MLLKVSNVNHGDKILNFDNVYYLITIIETKYFKTCKCIHIFLLLLHQNNYLQLRKRKSQIHTKRGSQLKGY